MRLVLLLEDPDGADQERDRAEDGEGDQDSAFWRSTTKPEPDEGDPDPVQPVDQEAREEEHVEGQERRARASATNESQASGPRASWDRTPRWR